MFYIIILLAVAFALVLLLKGASLLLSERVVLNREELSPYECGFEHHNVSRIPLSLRYFFLTLLFLLFDLEIVFLLFLPYVVLSNFIIYGVFVILFFIVFLYLSLIYEWNDGTLEWLLLKSKLIKVVRFIPLIWLIALF